ncbi:MAG TPA: tetratricopeptide repeat protein, partial [Blastocatellia bacterium]|nr:tetratricopeptide repeat protein [Blastocatellia bacterium]
MRPKVTARLISGGSVSRCLSITLFLVWLLRPEFAVGRNVQAGTSRSLPVWSLAQQVKQDTVARKKQYAAVLEPGKPIERELAGGQSHSYQIRLTAGQYLHLVADQRGVDVVIVLFGPDGKKLIEVDSPNGMEGPELLLWITKSNGACRLKIHSPDKNAAAGRYEVRIVELRAATEADWALLEALRMSNESADLRNQGKYSEAVSLAEGALALREKTLGPSHLDVALALYDLASLYSDKGDNLKAEPLFRRALEIREKTLGPQ